MLISQVMTRDVIIVSPDQSLKLAAQVMEQNDFDALPICDHNRLVGMLTIRDIVVKAVENGVSLENTSIESLMTNGARYVFDDQTTDYAVNLMNEHHLRRLLVLDRENHLVGIVSLADILSVNNGSGVATHDTSQQIKIAPQVWHEFVKRPRKQSLFLNFK